jgi:hypothetical protein
MDYPRLFFFANGRFARIDPEKKGHERRNPKDRPQGKIKSAAREDKKNRSLFYAA